MSQRSFAPIRVEVSSNNPVANVAELQLRVDEHADKTGHFELNAELRVYEDDFGDESMRCTIAFRRLHLRFQVSGLTVVSGSRYGDPLRKNEGSEKRTFKREESQGAAKSSGVDLAANLTASEAAKADVSIKGVFSRKRDRASKVNAEIERTEERQVFTVRARPNLVWEISEPDGSQLDGTYLDGDTVMQMKSEAGANRKAVEAFLSVKQKDIVYNWDDSSCKRFTATDRKVLAIFISKCLASDDYSGIVTLCHAESEC